LSFAETVLLGALAGFTIYLGLPLGRIELVGNRARVGLAMFAVGVLAFLLVDIGEHALEIVEHAVEGFDEGEESIWRVIGLVALLAGGFAAGTAGLATLERWMRPGPPTSPPIAGGSVDALTVEEAERLAGGAENARRRALQLGMTIAAAIGLHNFAEGLAIGVSASTGEIALATVLIIGFALHNATEGFGIVGPLGSVRPTWGWLGLAGLIGGGPVFLGAMVGYSVTSEPLELAFYGLAGGAILYVIGEVWNGMRRYGHRELGLWLLSAGFLLGIATDLVVVYGGG
jgi:zinc transporter, ZIP family